MQTAANSTVSVARTSRPSYDQPGLSQELATALLRLGASRGWSREGRGPLSAVVPPGARVVVKPNLVLHYNQGPGGMEPLITHPALIRTVVEALLATDAAQVVVGDAPLQACDFDVLMEKTGLGEWAAALAKREPRFGGIRDFRRTVSVFHSNVRVAAEDIQPLSGFSLFNLGTESLLEPISDGSNRFRVTYYDPTLMVRTHSRGLHQYLIAGDILDADMVVNLPKLKTHKKAGITCALKNLIGINGNKEFLPHHRVGGAKDGGDCYPGHSAVKLMLERVLDLQNTTKSLPMGRLYSFLARQLDRAARLTGDRYGVEGSWAGNDTIWRTCLDLNRILLYGKRDGSIADTRQRKVLHLVDAIVAGQGDGPLASDPLPMGLLMAGENAAAVDYIGAQLLGYDPNLIPLVRHAFDRFRWPIADFSPDEVTVAGDLDLSRLPRLSVAHPIGWRDAARKTETAMDVA